LPIFIGKLFDSYLAKSWIEQALRMWVGSDVTYFYGILFPAGRGPEQYYNAVMRNCDEGNELLVCIMSEKEIDSPRMATYECWKNKCAVSIITRRADAEQITKLRSNNDQIIN
jgi:hypothetical protein